MAAVGFLQTLGLIREDLKAHRRFFRDTCFRGGVSWPFHPGWIGVFLYRWCRYFHQKPPLRILSRLLYLLNIAVGKTEMTPVSDIGPGFVVIHPCGNIVASANIGRDSVMAGGGLGGAGSRKDIGAGPGLPVLGSRVFFDHQGFALGPYRVADGAEVGPKCFVHRDLEEGEFMPPQVDEVTMRRVLRGRRDARLDDDVYYTPEGVNKMGGDHA